MDAEIEFEMTGALWQAAARYLWRHFVWQYAWWALALLALALIVFPRIAGPRGLLMVLVLAAVAGGLLVVGYRAFVQKTRTQAAGMQPGFLVYRITDEGLHVPLSSGEAMYEWKQFHRLVRQPDVWLLFYTKTGALILAPDAVSAEVAEFIVRKVRDSGGKVI